MGEAKAGPDVAVNRTEHTLGPQARQSDKCIPENGPAGFGRFRLVMTYNSRWFRGPGQMLVEMVGQAGLRLRVTIGNQALLIVPHSIALKSGEIGVIRGNLSYFQGRLISIRLMLISES